MCKLNFWKLQHLLALMMFVLALPVSAQDSYYTRVDPPQPTDQPAKIEVIEFFAFSCPHCSNLYAPLAAWVKKLPPDVVFKRIPVCLLYTSIAGAVAVAWLLKHLTAAGRQVRPLMMELPSYHWPAARNIAIGIWQRVAIFVKRVGSCLLYTSRCV